MAVDNALVGELQEEISRILHAERQRRDASGMPPLDGDDLRQRRLAAIHEVVNRYEERVAKDRPGAWVTDSERNELVSALEAQMWGAGRLQHLLEDADVENVDINGCDDVWVSYRGKSSPEKAAPVAANDEELAAIVQGLAGNVGLNSRAFDAANPELDLRLPDGARLSATHPSVSTRLAISIRRNTMAGVTLADLVAGGTLDRGLATFLRALVKARKNVMISGSTNAGKTTLLRAMAAEIHPDERIITIERSLELGLGRLTDRHPNVVEYEEKLPNNDESGAVTLAQLVRRSTRMNPSRVIVGEVLGDEVITMLNAMSQGNDGSLSTIHARSATETFTRITTYAIQAKEHLPVDATNYLIAGAIDFVVFVRKVDDPTSDSHRIVDSVIEVNDIGDDARVARSVLWESKDGITPATRTQVPISEARDAQLRPFDPAHGYSRGDGLR